MTEASSIGVDQTGLGRRSRRAVCLLFLAATTAPLPAQSQATNDIQKWRMPLAEKAEKIQRNILEIHDVEGTYVPTVPLPPDHTVSGRNGDMHTSSWTGCYLMGIAFRLGWARKSGTRQDVDSALELGGRILDGITMLSRISGTPGMLARYVVRGHGVGPEERTFDNARNWWFQGKGRYQDFRYRSHPSHHNYHHVLRGLAHYYYFLTKDNPTPAAREKAQIELTRTLVNELMEFAYKKNNMVLIREDGSVSAQQLLTGVMEGRPSTRALMATNCLKFAYWITSDGWYRERYEELVERFKYRSAGVIPPDQWQGSTLGLHTPDHDDTEHTLPSLWLVSQLEQEPKLRAFYKMAIAQIFSSKRDHKRTPFNFFYAAATGDTTGADMAGALETLRLFPSDWTMLPIMNSIRNDIKTVQRESGRESASVLPFNQQPYDNAYTWKANPFQLDRYQAREIVSLSISAEDPYVWLLCDARGTLYRSYDGGKTFQVHPQPPGSRVHSVTFASNRSRVAVIATDTGVYWTQQGGYEGTWQKASLGAGGESARRVMLDPVNRNVVWAIAPSGVYRSEDLGLEGVGKVWQKASRPFPGERDTVYGVGLGRRNMIYATSRGKIYRHEVGASSWTLTPRDTEEYHMIPEFRDAVVSPSNSDNVFFLLSVDVWGQSWPVVLHSSDAAGTLAVTGLKLPRAYLPSKGSGLENVRMHKIAIDPRRDDTIYGASDKGFCRSSDGGMTWEVLNKGLRIPYAYQVFAPAESPGKLYLSTPAGLHLSTDSGATWSKPIVVLNGLDTRPTDRGGMEYLVAYWPGRYFGFIDDKEARRVPGEE
ncbi:MAG: hypothetical protein IT168_01130 [Bryobacterales bacterium]|nr:hypothetical protein [Bryobacterales bacterium]